MPYTIRFLPLLVVLVQTSLCAQDFRYTESLFPAAVTTPNVIFANVPFINFPYTNESNTSNADLEMDIFQPQGDTCSQRPAIIFAHSGGFLTGSRDHDDMLAACDTFARKGYVTATIDYRQGFNILTNAELHGTRAVYRGIQDGRSAVRFLRANAATYGIDANRIYLAGSSAGSFVALHAIYMDEPDEKPDLAGPVSYVSIIPPFFFSGPDLGSVDIGDHLNENGTPEAVAGWWGAIEDTDLITPNDTEGVFLAHGSEDETVPFITGPPFGLATFPDVDGSFRIDSTLDALSLTNKDTYFIDGAGHEFHGTTNGSWDDGMGGNARWDTLVAKTTQFLWQQHRPLADFSFLASDLIVNFSDESDGASAWQWDFGDGQSSTAENPIHTYAAAGDYSVRLYIENEIRSWDTISYVVTASAPLPVRWASALSAVPQEQNVQLSWSINGGVEHAYFAVEQQQANSEFITIGWVGEPLIGGYQTFRYLHQGAGPGIHTYRLRQVDLDGSYAFSAIAVASIGLDDWVVYPNPARDEISIDGLPLGSNITVIDALGRVRLRTTIATENMRINLSGLSAGTYLLQTTAVERRRFVKF